MPLFEIRPVCRYDAHVAVRDVGREQDVKCRIGSDEIARQILVVRVLLDELIRIDSGEYFLP